MITDVHIHLRQICDLNPKSVEYILNTDYSAIVSCHSIEDFEFAEKIKNLKDKNKGSVYISYGVHPFSLEYYQLKLLEKFVAEKKLDAIGEIGLDKFSHEQKQSFSKQVEFFEVQLDIARKAKLPVILHIRKSFQELFQFSRKLSQIPAVVFHSYSGTANEAAFILSRNINGFFSFGTSILNGHTKAISAVAEIPLEKMLIETDSPYQPLKNKEYTGVGEIELILLKISEIKKIDLLTIRQIIHSNFGKILTKV